MAEQACLGIIGGMGPMATVYFMQRLVEMTAAEKDQEHLAMLVYNMPSIPDRTGHILDPARPDPAPHLARISQALLDQGASCLAMPCMTAHFYYEQILGAMTKPVLVHAVRETALLLQKEGVKRVGLAATDGTLAAALFQDELAKYGICSLVPDQPAQKGLMQLIYHSIKSGIRPDPAVFQSAALNLRQQGAELIVLACTELSLLKRDFLLGPGVLDALDVLAKAALLACAVPVKAEFASLLTKEE